MDMSGMEGMDMGSATMFAAHNSALARSYWYIIAGILGFAFLLRCVGFLQTIMRVRLSQSRAVRYPTQPQDCPSQIYATILAVFRELSAPEVYFDRHGLSWLSPPSLGRGTVLLIYWAVIIYMLTSEAVVNDAYYWERIGFRAAWISATQVPFVYLLASKSSIIGLLAGTSHDRLNWLHRWVSRTLLVTVTVHGGFFFTEWWRASFISLELSMMPIVKYGMGAWFVLVWTFLSSLAPIRQLTYELFVLQHIAAAAVFLWLIYAHMPSYARYNFWFALAALALDKALTLGITIRRNINFRNLKNLGYRVEIRPIDSDITEVIIPDVRFSWTAGQHIYLRVPMIGPWEAHPFTIATAHQSSGINNIRLYIKAKKGFTRRLQKKVKLLGDSEAYKTTAFITGPFGWPPTWKSFETLILISSSSGASFTLPIIDSILKSPELSCVKRIDVLMIVRNKYHIKFCLPRLNAAIANAESANIMLNITIAITCPCNRPPNSVAEDNYVGTRDDLVTCKCGNKFRSEVLMLANNKSELHSAATLRQRSSQSYMSEKPTCCHEAPNDDDPIAEAAYCSSSPSLPAMNNHQSPGIVPAGPSSPPALHTPKISYFIGSRPDIQAFIRGPVEATGGETSVAVCGGRSLCATTRNFVAALSDERAVHKGSGAQGIHLHSETYCF